MIDVGLIEFGIAGKAFHAPVISAVDGLAAGGDRRTLQAKRCRSLS